jgi:hypothetical protein
MELILVCQFISFPLWYSRVVLICTLWCPSKSTSLATDLVRYVLLCYFIKSVIIQECNNIYKQVHTFIELLQKSLSVFVCFAFMAEILFHGPCLMYVGNNSFPRKLCSLSKSCGLVLTGLVKMTVFLIPRNIVQIQILTKIKQL